MKIKKHILILALSAVTLTACENIKEGDRWLDLPAIEDPDDPGIDVPDLPVPKRTVLLEEYTGQACVNCSNAHNTISLLNNQYGERFIPISIHGGNFSWSSATYGVYGLANEESMAYVSESGAISFPSGQVNRCSGIIGMADWSGKIRTEMARETPVALKLTPSLSDDNATISIKVEGGATAAVNGKLLVWVVESGITAPQLLTDGKTYDPAYVHNHVFRACVNGKAGADVSVAEYTAQDEDIYKSSWTYSIAANPAWNIANISIVAFIYDAQGVIQAIEATVGETAMNEVVIPEESTEEEQE